MRQRTLAHLSDLHFGLSPAAEKAATGLCRALIGAAIDHVVVSGDITHRGRRDELDRFKQIFHPLLRTGRMTVVAGNHDRLGDDVRVEIMGQRVSRVITDGLCIVRLDSTAPHNRTWFASHGEVTLDELDQMVRLLDSAPPDALRAVTLHHHPLPLPEDSLGERLVSRLGSPNGLQLAHGPELIRRLSGRCDLVLHGHRHVPREIALCSNERLRPLRIVNAGSSTELGMVRIFRHARGRLIADPFWMSVPGEPRRPSLGVMDALRSMSLF